MHRRLLRILIVLAGSLALSTGALTAPTGAAAPGPWSTSSVLQGTITWTRLGTDPGGLGNAHSGLFIYVGDETYAAVDAYDWRCPRGVRPPTEADTSGPCTLLASTSSTPVDATAGVRATGVLAASLRGTWDVAYAVWHDGTAGSPTSYQRTPDAQVTRVGPVTRTVADEVADGVETRTTTYTAPMRLRGYVPETTLDSRSAQSSTWSRTVTQTRSVG